MLNEKSVDELDKNENTDKPDLRNQIEGVVLKGASAFFTPGASIGIAAAAAIATSKGRLDQCEPLHCLNDRNYGTFK